MIHRVNDKSTGSMYLRITTGEKARKQGIHPGFEASDRRPKQGYQWPHKKDLCPPKI